MAVKKPLCNYAGVYRELQSGDSLPSSGGVTTEDMNGVWSIIDQNIGATLIANTSKQASPDWTYTLQPSDIPSDARVTDWMVVITLGGKNNDAVNNRTPNAHYTYNGTEIAGGDASRLTTPSLPYWSINALIYGPVSSGDVIGVKLWADAASVVDYRYATIYVLPRTFNLPESTDKLCCCAPYDADSSNAIGGAATGVTYAFGDVIGASSVAAIQSGIRGTDSGFAAITPPATYTQNVSVSNNGLNQGLSASPQLLGISKYRRYFHRLT